MDLRVRRTFAIVLALCIYRTSWLGHLMRVFLPWYERFFACMKAGFEGPTKDLSAEVQIINRGLIIYAGIILFGICMKLFLLVPFLLVSCFRALWGLPHLVMLGLPNFIPNYLARPNTWPVGELDGFDDREFLGEQGGPAQEENED